MQKLNLIIVLALMSFTHQLSAGQPLPGGHKLLKNEQGQYYVENKEGIVMIDPAIVSIGHSNQWIVACSKNESIDTDLKRFFFINLKNGGTTDTINQENWQYFQGVYDGLADVETTALVDDTCP